MDKDNVGKRVRLTGPMVEAWGEREGVITGVTSRGYIVHLDGALYDRAFQPEELILI